MVGWTLFVCCTQRTRCKKAANIRNLIGARLTVEGCHSKGWAGIWSTIFRTLEMIFFPATTLHWALRKTERVDQARTNVTVLANGALNQSYQEACSAILWILISVCGEVIGWKCTVVILLLCLKWFFLSQYEAISLFLSLWGQSFCDTSLAALCAFFTSVRQNISLPVLWPEWAVDALIIHPLNSATQLSFPAFLTVQCVFLRFVCLTMYSCLVPELIPIYDVPIS